MKILAVCGFGVGSSLVLKMTIERVLRELSIEAEVENTDISTAQSVSCDAIFTSAQFAENLEGNVKCPIFTIEKYVNKEEVMEAVKKFLDTK